MKESVTYQMILREGEALGEARGEGNEARKIVLLLGRDKFGEPSRAVQTALEGITDIERLEELALKVAHATSWQQLLGLPGPRRRSVR